MQNTLQKRNRQLPKLSVSNRLTHARRVQKTLVTDATNGARKTQKTITAVELRKMPLGERSKLLRAAARKAVKDYEPGGSLWIEGAEDIVEY
jgi:hypothetical protein